MAVIIAIITMSLVGWAMLAAYDEWDKWHR